MVFDVGAHVHFSFVLLEPTLAVRSLSLVVLVNDLLALFGWLWLLRSVALAQLRNLLEAPVRLGIVLPERLLGHALLFEHRGAEFVPRV